MTAWPDTDGRIVERYVAQRRLRCPTTPIYYRQALHSFRKVVVRRQKSRSEGFGDLAERR